MDDLPEAEEEQKLSPEILLLAYRHGIFPMADSAEDGAVYWYAPDPRSVLPLDGFHVSKSLKRVVRSGKFEVVIDRDFEAVMRECALPREGEGGGTWISEEFVETYTHLHQLGFAHSVECWYEGELAGGLYGVSIGGAFMGESMFHRVTDASKVALYHLVKQMRERGMVLLDVQFTTDHLRKFGVVEISRDDYEERLAAAIKLPVTFV